MSDSASLELPPSTDEFYQKRLTRANRWLMSACKTLAICRKLALPAIQGKMASVEIGSAVVVEATWRE
jgi:hypothetical protein